MACEWPCEEASAVLNRFTRSWKSIMTAFLSARQGWLNLKKDRDVVSEGFGLYDSTIRTVPR
jgi:hypothetical protein